MAELTEVIFKCMFVYFLLAGLCSKLKPVIKSFTFHCKSTQWAGNFAHSLEVGIEAIQKKIWFVQELYFFEVNSLLFCVNLHAKHVSITLDWNKGLVC